MLIQIFIILFALYAMSRVINRYLRKEISVPMLLAWTLLWVAVMIAGILPDTTTYVAQLVGVGRGADFVIYISIIVLFYLLFRIYGKIYTLEKDITKVVTYFALENTDYTKKMKKQE